MQLHLKYWKVGGESTQAYINTRFVVIASNSCEGFFSTAVICLDERKRNVLTGQGKSQLFLDIDKTYWDFSDVQALVTKNRTDYIILRYYQFNNDISNQTLATKIIWQSTENPLPSLTPIYVNYSIYCWNWSQLLNYPLWSQIVWNSKQLNFHQQNISPVPSFLINYLGLLSFAMSFWLGSFCFFYFPITEIIKK